MQRRHAIQGLAIIILVSIAWMAATRITTAQAGSSIRISLDCKSDPERTILFNSTTQTLNIDGWVLSSLYRPITAVEPFVLSGSIAPNSSFVFSTGSGAPTGQSQLIYDNVDPSEGVRIQTPHGTYNVLCVTGSAEFQINPLATPAPSSTVAATPTATVTVTGSQLWLTSPPSASGVTSGCPSAGEWLLLYWSGPTVPIGQAVTACVVADVFWQRQNDRWSGYSQISPQASDSWSVEQGAAAFIHGRN